MQEDSFLKHNNSPKLLLVLDVVFILFYFGMLLFFFQKGVWWLWGLLMIGEVFHVWQALTFISTIWETDHHAFRDPSFAPAVDIFITVAGEPVDVVEKTVRAALKMQYAGTFKIYILNDGYVAKKDNWQDIEKLANRLGVACITRRIAGGAKAGNINHALLLTQSPFVAIFDADHLPEENFLSETVPFFVDSKLAFVQTPQFYQNQNSNFISRGAWEQQTLFFGAICKGKNRLNAVTMCGTNMVIRREALEDVNGICETSIAEDFITGFFLHRRGWKSLYLPKILARGLAPIDFRSYYKQQDRWARGSLDLIFRHNLLFTRGLTLKQRIQYLSSVSYFLSGWIVLIDAILPIIFFTTGLFPIQNSTMSLAMIFLPYMSLMLYTIQRSSNFSFSYRAIAFSVAPFNIHITASFKSLFRQKSKFSVTAKKAQSGDFRSLVVPQIIYIVVALASAGYAVYRMNGAINAAWVANVAWALVNCFIFGEYIKAASPKASSAEALEYQPIPVTLSNVGADSENITS